MFKRGGKRDGCTETEIEREREEEKEREKEKEKERERGVKRGGSFVSSSYK